MAGLLLRCGDPCLPVVTANAGVIWATNLFVDCVDPLGQGHLDCFVDHQAAHAIRQRRNARAGGDLHVDLVAIVQVDAVEPAIVPKVADLDAVEDHDVCEPSNQQSKRNDLVVDAHALTNARELATDLLASGLWVAHHVVQNLQSGPAIAAVLRHARQKVAAKCVQVVGRARARLATACRCGCCRPCKIFFNVQIASCGLIDEHVDAIEGVQEQAFLRVRGNATR